MAQRDYILREIERIGELMAALRRRILARLGVTEATAVRNDLEHLGQRAGLDATLLRTLTADTLALMIRGRAAADPATCWLWAEFLYVDGLTLEAEGKDDAAHDRFAKALLLYGLLDAPLAGAWLDQVPERIREIEQRLGDTA